jgi:photosystem II P680 reaction center D1 protein
MAGHYGYLGRVLIPPFASGNSRAFHFWMAAFPTIGIWFAALGVGSMAFNLNRFNFQHSILDSQGKVINTNADVINRANLGIQSMHAPNAHNFPLLLAGGEGVPVSIAPTMDNLQS